VQGVKDWKEVNKSLGTRSGKKLKAYWYPDIHKSYWITPYVFGFVWIEHPKLASQVFRVCFVAIKSPLSAMRSLRNSACS